MQVKKKNARPELNNVSVSFSEFTSAVSCILLFTFFIMTHTSGLRGFMVNKAAGKKKKEEKAEIKALTALGNVLLW